QIETLNPHLHEEKGKAHIIEMIAASLGSIYHSRVADQDLRVRIVKEMDEFNVKEEPPKPKIIPPIVGVNAEKFFDVLQSNAKTLEILE
ncbi:MAG: mannosyl-3-phosphoglycerate synthase, partial [Candidatus Baldrarchaeia archaeon]